MFTAFSYKPRRVDVWGSGGIVPPNSYPRH